MPYWVYVVYQAAGASTDELADSTDVEAYELLKQYLPGGAKVRLRGTRHTQPFVLVLYLHYIWADESCGRARSDCVISSPSVHRNSTCSAELPTSLLVCMVHELPSWL